MKHARPSSALDRKAALAIAVAALAPCATLAAPGDRLGPEFKVNSITRGNQDSPALAHGVNGDFVVVWADYSTRDAGVYFRRYHANGTAKDPLAVKVAAPFGTDVAEGLVANPEVAMDDDGDFVVVWQNHSDPRYPSSSVRLRRYAADGSPRDAAPRALSGPCLSVESGQPSVAMDSTGDFVVAYQSYFSDANYASFRITATRYRADGTDAGCIDLDFGYAPQVAMESDGDFVIAYEAYADGGAAGPLRQGIVARRYTADGAPRDPDRILVAAVPPLVFPSDIAVNDLGEFIMTWAQAPVSNPDTASDILMRRYGADGTAKAAAEQVNAAGSGIHREPKIGLADDGSFTLAWERLPAAQDNAEVFWRRFGADASPFTPFHLRANSLTLAFQDDPAIAVNPDGSFVVAWESQDQDGSGDGIYAQRFAGSPESLPTLRFQRASSIAPEDAGTIKLRLLLSGASTRDVSVPISLGAGGSARLNKDYRLPVARVAIPAGQTRANLRLRLLDDRRRESAETIVLDLGAPVHARPGPTDPQRLTIIDND